MCLTWNSTLEWLGSIVHVPVAREVVVLSMVLTGSLPNSCLRNHYSDKLRVQLKLSVRCRTTRGWSVTTTTRPAVGPCGRGATQGVHRRANRPRIGGPRWTPPPPEGLAGGSQNGPHGRPVQDCVSRSASAWSVVRTDSAGSRVAAQLPRSFSASSEREPGSAA